MGIPVNSCGNFTIHPNNGPGLPMSHNRALDRLIANWPKSLGIPQRWSSIRNQVHYDDYPIQKRLESNSIHQNKSGKPN
jgi:hypothetical protein